MIDHHFPVAGTAYLVRHHPTARVLTGYGWGGHVLNELYPGGGLGYADGRMHKYGGAVLDDYSAIVGADPVLGPSCRSVLGSALSCFG